VFGHTFNKDTWVPNASAAYFHIGELKYIPSERWLGSYLVHDDNFGSNFCVPRLFVTARQVQYVLALHPKGVRFDGVTAEVVGAFYLYSLLKNAHLNVEANVWMKRLKYFANGRQIVLRTVALSKEDYVHHLASLRDWDYHRERSFIPNGLRASGNFPKLIWMIEISVPELFPANRRKLGEIVLEAAHKPSAKPDFSSFVFARFPGSYWFFNGLDREGEPKFEPAESRLSSHTHVFRGEELSTTFNTEQGF
jgi:hypothetical protein